ncbi:MAG: hypothetical protein H6951_18255 [Zoogloeaceae bacterium]|nr:hypothetical protein [Zoogloeaceae bacterium]
MVDDTQEFIVEGEATAKALNAKYVPQTEMAPVDFAAAEIRNPVIWLDKPNVKSTPKCRVNRIYDRWIIWRGLLRY